jgi:hypothetical protein
MKTLNQNQDMQGKIFAANSLIMAFVKSILDKINISMVNLKPSIHMGILYDKKENRTTGNLLRHVSGFCVSGTYDQSLGDLNVIRQRIVAGELI